MKKWIVLSGLWIAVFVFHGYVCFADAQICVNISDDLYKALVITVENENNTGVTNNKDYVLQTAPGYLEKNVCVWLKSYKDELERKALNNPDLREMALKLINLPVEKQKELKQILDNAVASEKPK